jgi:signal transduction protein with GAF and PtsI domain
MEQLLAAIMSSEEEVASQNVDLELLNALSHEVSGTLHSYAILEAAVEQTQKVLGVEASWCYLFEDGVLNLHGHQGLSDQYVAGMQHLTPGDGVEGMAFSHKEPFLRDGVLFHSGQARALVQEEGLRTVAAVPVQIEEKILGVLAVANRHDWVWSSRDKRMLTSISQQVARAIGNSQRFIEVQEKAQNWETNYNVLQNTNVQLTERTQVLEQHVQELQHVKQQIWVALAASQRSRHQSTNTDPYTTDEQLVAILKKALTTMDTKEH